LGSCSIPAAIRVIDIPEQLAAMLRFHAAHWLRGQVGYALVPCTAAGRREGIAGSLLPGARGYRTNLWTTARIARLIAEEFGVDYHPKSHWSVDASPAMESSETGTACHREKRETDRAMETPTMAADKKTARLGAHLVFADESGFLLIPNVAKTWAPVGQTPAATGGVGTGILLPARYSRAG